jgi:hypothetical protein
MNFVVLTFAVHLERWSKRYLPNPDTALTLTPQLRLRKINAVKSLRRKSVRRNSRFPRKVYIVILNFVSF